LRIAAAVAGIALALAIAWELSPYGYRPGQYRTGIGEQRIVELDDHSRLDLDAATTLRVRYSDTARIIEFTRGQAQFSVAPDPVRPFRVQVGDRTIVALGTVFTVEYTGREVRVAMMEGKVAISGASSSSTRASTSLITKNVGDAGAGEAIALSPGKKEGLARGSSSDSSGKLTFLSAGQELRSGPDGNATVIRNADIEAATAWRERKVIFRTEPLGEAIQRLNRYSRVQIEVDDPSLATEEISGVFDIGATQDFVRDIQRYLPVTADASDPDRIRLRWR
jgi:transmembrane sensor